MNAKIGLSITPHNTDWELRERHRAILRFVHQFTQQFGYAPTVREIALALDISAPSMVNAYLSFLDRKGYIHRTSRTSRSIRLSDAGYRVIGQSQPYDLQAEVSRLLAENNLLRERCEHLQRECDHLLTLSNSPGAASASP